MPKDTGRKSVSPLLLGGAVLASLVIAVAVGLNLEGEPASEEARSPSTAQSAEGGQQAGAEDPERRAPEDPMSLGAQDAPVVMVAYSDYMCSFCAAWARDVQPELVERYVDQGQLRIEWREFPYLGDLSRTLAAGALAAAEQDRFWDYQEKVFGQQNELRSAGDPEAAVTEIARELGLDPDRFAQDLADEQVQAAVDDDFTEGQRLGVSATPAFLVNGDPLMGAQPLDVFVRGIDGALSAAEE